ncbi:hypothetical protein G7054_g146 [Neopestalotiopsis clavispora]|nr:hypothetical protein G7054_g146 [Neopestalotiopsis clavispora]
MASSKRQSVLPRGQVGPKAPVNFSSSITISDTAILTGNHTINVSSDSVIHPRARFDSTKGRVTVGRRCIIHERTHIGASEPNQPSASFGVLMDDFVTIEVSAIIESGETTIGEGTVIGIGAKIGRGAKIGKHCTITAKSIIQPGETVPDNTVVYANGSRRLDRRDIAELKFRGQTRQIEVLRRLIPSNPAKFKE